MHIIQNLALQRMQEGKLVLGFGVNQLRGSSPGMLAALCGYDWLFIDMEHGAISVDAAAQMAIAALGQGVTPMVRCCKDALFEGVRVLDNGAMGIIVPHVNTAADAEKIVATCRFPPRGVRSMVSTLAQLGYASPDYEKSMAALDEQTLVIVMIESTEAVENADAIAAVEGIDILLIGSADLSASMRIAGQVDHQKIRGAYETVSKACRKNSKVMGIGGVGNQETIREYVRLGGRFILAGTDVSFIKSGATMQSKLVREL